MNHVQVLQLEGRYFTLMVPGLHTHATCPLVAKVPVIRTVTPLIFESLELVVTVITPTDALV